MNPVEIDEVEQLSDPRLRGSHLDGPATGAGYDFHGLPIHGWVVGESAPVLGVGAGNVIDLEMVSTPLTRPHVQAVKAGAAEPGATCGFITAMSSFMLEETFEIDVVAMLETRELVPFARIRGRRRPLPTIEAALAPLLLSTVGRSGSTYAALLLSRHPEITAYSPIGYETRIGTYWMHALQALVEPRGFLASLKAEPGLPNWWLPRPESWVPAKTPHPEMATWLGSEAVEEIASFCGSRIDAFMRQFVKTEGDRTARFFLEKHPLSPRIPRLIRDLMPSSREIFLVRDFRDVACSMRSYNEKKGISMLGGGADDTEEEWVRRFGDLAQSFTLIRERRPEAHLLRYEDLLREPEKTLAGVLEHVGVDDSSPATVAAMLEEARVTQGERQARHATTSSPESSIGRFRKELSPEIQELCWDVMGENLQRLGYRR